eukprot:3548393-Rhodomonas_salina.2
MRWRTSVGHTPSFNTLRRDRPTLKGGTDALNARTRWREVRCAMEHVSFKPRDEGKSKVELACEMMMQLRQIQDTTK